MYSFKGRFWCDVCQINCPNEAEYALHEFSKKHCDNLLRIARNKPVVPKQKTTKAEPQEKEAPKVNVVTTPGSFAMYGYFVPGEVYKTGEEPKEFNTDYDPYLQKFAENPYKEKPEVPNATAQPAVTMPTVNVTSFSRKKKKKIRTCQICNVTLLTVPEYEAHMRSPQHTWKLKISGMGVSAHFVKASTDLHTTDINEDSNSNDATEETETPEINTPNPAAPAVPFPSLFCDVCELLLNSEQQYNAHVNGKSHNENVQRKAELKAKKEKLQSPVPNQLYCYSCKLSLNNLFQYNEHKNGKKHKSKCRQLMREGITIPPEERVASWGNPRIDPNKPVRYPEQYEKYVLEPQRKFEAEKIVEPIIETEKSNQTTEPSITITANLQTGMYHCEICNVKFNTASKYELHIKGKEHQARLLEVIECSVCKIIFKNKKELESHNASESHLEKLQSLNVEKPAVQEPAQDSQQPVKPAIVFYNKKYENENVKTDEDMDTQCATGIEAGTEVQAETKADVEAKLEEHTFLYLCNTCKVEFRFTTEQLKNHLADPSHVPKPDVKLPEKVVTEVSITDEIKCNVCELSFKIQSQFEYHLGTEEHARKILDLKNNGMSDDDILTTLYTDKKVAKPDKFGRYFCSICNVKSSNLIEFNQHLSSIVHKYTDKDYKKKKLIEVKQMVKPDENGKYTCKLCNEGWGSLVEYNQHLHSSNHKTIQRVERAKKIAARRRALILQQKRLKQKNFMSAIRRKHFGFWKKSEVKNPGVRTKISGIATDIFTGEMAQIPNLEPLEPKIDPAKNVQLGISIKPENNEGETSKKAKKRKVKKVKRRDRNLVPDMPNQGGYMPPPLLPPGPMGFPRNQNWAPYPPPCPPPYPNYRMGPFNPRPRPLYPINPYPGPSRFPQPSWGRYPPGYR